MIQGPCIFAKLDDNSPSVDPPSPTGGLRILKFALWVELLTEKLKVHQFQICCARTKYLSEIHKSWTIIVKAIFSQFVLDLKGLSVKNWAIFGSSDF